ncbi:MAG: hypothetical protein WKG01_03510, partial [Kofleriaceae bacterium]
STTTVTNEVTGRARGVILAALIAVCLMRWVSRQAFAVGLWTVAACLAWALTSYSALNLGVLVSDAAYYPRPPGGGSWWTVLDYAATAAMEIVLVLGATRLAVHPEAVSTRRGKKILAAYAIVFFCLFIVRGVYEIAILIKFPAYWHQPGLEQKWIVSKAARAPYLLMGVVSAGLWTYVLLRDLPARKALRCVAWLLLLVAGADEARVRARARARTTPVPAAAPGDVTRRARADQARECERIDLELDSVLAGTVVTDPAKADTLFGRDPPARGGASCLAVGLRGDHRALPGVAAISPKIAIQRSVGFYVTTRVNFRIVEPSRGAYTPR